MSRPKHCRRIEDYPLYRSFSPDDVRASEQIILSVDEYETLRLLDYQGLSQADCALKMNVSRTTITSIYERARKKLVDALVNGKQLLIKGGCCEFPTMKVAVGKKENNIMRIAVTYDNGQVFQHFGHCQQFKLYDVADESVVKEQLVAAGGSGHGALAGFLQAAGVDVLICGGIGMGARMALGDVGIDLCAGVQGSCDERVKEYISGKLVYDDNAACNHHEHHDGDCNHDHCDDHHCGGHN